MFTNETDLINSGDLLYLEVEERKKHQSSNLQIKYREIASNEPLNTFYVHIDKYYKYDIDYINGGLFMSHFYCLSSILAVHCQTQ